MFLFENCPTEVPILTSKAYYQTSGRRTKSNFVEKICKDISSGNRKRCPPPTKIWENLRHQPPTNGKNDFDHGFSDQNQQNQENHRKVGKSKSVKIIIF